MWSAIRPAVVHATRAAGTVGSLTVGGGLTSLASRVVVCRIAPCASRLAGTGRRMASAAANAKRTVTGGGRKSAPRAAKNATAKGGTAKPRAAKGKKSKAAATKSLPKAKKPMTPEQKKAAEVKRLKEKALLNQPERQPNSSWTVFLSQKLKGLGTKVGSASTDLSRSYQQLSASEMENLKEIAQQNATANKANYKAWVESHTPSQVKEANAARSRLRRLHKVNVPQIKDARKPKRARTAFSLFVQAKASTRSPTQSITDHLKDLGSEWKTLPEADRKPFLDMAIADKARYQKDKEAVGI